MTEKRRIADEKLIEFQNTYELTGKIEDVISLREINAWCRHNNAMYLYFTDALESYAISKNILRSMNRIKVKRVCCFSGIKKRVVNS